MTYNKATSTAQCEWPSRMWNVSSVHVHTYFGIDVTYKHIYLYIIFNLLTQSGLSNNPNIVNKVGII